MKLMRLKKKIGFSARFEQGDVVKVVKSKYVRNSFNIEREKWIGTVRACNIMLAVPADQLEEV